MRTWGLGFVAKRPGAQAVIAGFRIEPFRVAWQTPAKPLSSSNHFLPPYYRTHRSTAWPVTHDKVVRHNCRHWFSESVYVELKLGYVRPACHKSIIGN